MNATYTMSRIQEEKDYWNKAAQDPDVDVKFIADRDLALCKQDLAHLNGQVLEIGCGVGRLLEKNWWGIDTSREMIRIAKQRGHKNVLQNNGRTIPFDAAKFDNVYSYLVFQHLPIDAVQSYINEAHRVLKQDGVLTFQCILGDEDEPFSKHISPDKLRTLLKKFNTWEMTESYAYNQWRIVRCNK